MGKFKYVLYSWDFCCELHATMHTVNYKCLIKCKESVECHQTLTLLGRVWDLRLDLK